MAISFITSNTNAYSDTGPTVSATWTPQENDLLIVYVSCTNTFALTPVTGWTDPLEGQRVYPGDSSTESACIIHLVTAGEATAGTTSYSLAGLFNGGSEVGRWWLVVVRGVDSAEPVDGVGWWWTADLLSTHQLAGITGTTLGDDSLVVRFVSTDAANRTYTAPADHTELHNGGTNTGGWAGYRNALTIAGVDVPEEPISVITGDEGLAISVAVKAAAGAPASNVHTKASGTFGDGVVKVKTSGTFSDATVKNKSGGVWA